MATTTHPDPSFQYEGASLTLPGTRIGPMTLCRARTVGTNYAADPGLKIPAVTIRPDQQEIHDDDPCTSQFEVFYTQYRGDPLNGVDYPMVFRLTSDLIGGVIGVDASLEVESSYPEIKMSIPRFTFTQAGFGIMKEGTLPGNYQARLTVRVWNRDADIDIDGWVMLEAGYHRDDPGTGTEPDTDALVAVGRASLYPAPATSRRADGS